MVTEDGKYDKRIVKVNIKRGNVTKEDFEKSIKSLEDSGDNVDEIKQFENESES